MQSRWPSIPIGPGAAPEAPTLPAVTLSSVQAAATRAERSLEAALGSALAGREAERGSRSASVGLPPLAPSPAGAFDDATALLEFRAAVRMAEELLLVLEHDLCGSLAVIKGRAQLLQRQVARAPQADPRLAFGLRQIDEAVDRLVERFELGLLDVDRRPPTDRSTVDW